MTYLPHVFARKPLYAALAAASLSFGGLGMPAVASAAQTATLAATATSPPAQTSDSTTAKTAGKKKNDKNEKPVVLQGMVVTGYRQSIDENLQEKRNANEIVEVVNAQNIAQFPAQNIADALQFVPGVVISRSDGEGKNISIRGLAPELTLTELNGNYVASADTSSGLDRSFNYQLLPANMFSSVKLYKSQMASLDEGGIGGVVETHTRKPLDMKSNDGFISVNGTGADNNAKLNQQVSGLYSWHNSDSTFGVLVGGAYNKRQETEYTSTASNWYWWANNYGTQPPVSVGGNQFGSFVEPNIPEWGNVPPGGIVDQGGRAYSGYWMPQQFSTSQTQLNLKNKAAQLTLQFKPSDRFQMTANYFRFQLDRNQITNTLEIPEWNLPTDTYANQQGNLLAPNGLRFDPSGTIVTGANYRLPAAGTGCNSLTNPVTGAQRQPVDVCSTQTPWLNGNYSVEKATSQTANIEGEWNTGGILSGTFNLGRTWATGGPSVEFGVAAKPRNFVNGQWVDGAQYSQWTLSGTPGISASTDTLQNMLAGEGQVDLGSTGSGFINTATSQNVAQADFTLDFDKGWLSSVQFGAKYRYNTAYQQSGQLRWYCPGTDQQFQSCDPNAGDLQPSLLLPYELTTNTLAYHDNIFPGINFPAYYNYLNQTYNPATYMDPDNQAKVRESISAAYVQVNFDTDTLHGNFGMRYVDTLQDVTTADQVTTYYADYYHGPDGSILICPASGVNSAGGPCAPGDFEYLPQQCASAADGAAGKCSYYEAYTLNTQRRRYRNFLPSFNLVWNFADSFDLRVAANRAMARANYGDLAQLGSLNDYLPTYYSDRSQFGSPLPGWYGSGADNNLQPFIATQYDAAVEWYYAPESVLGFDLFYKTVKNFVVPVQVNNFTVDVGGTPTLFAQYSTNANGQSGVSKGIELYTQHTWSSGFGVIANYTLNKTNSTAVSIGDTRIGSASLIGSAKYAGNLSLFYQKNGLLLRASSNWTGRVMDGLAAGLPEYTAPYNEVDLNGQYQIDKHLMVTASILNLTRSTTRSYLGSDTADRLNTLEYDGRQYYLGLTYKFGVGD
ncbi:TonB-dependent receptor [Rhodanobacter sp. Si-c]|uniref:TonB-dependent receptor n=1 Tax=Rhodanobacter lycopersici TaxID=3162487 RepID=A0ABV3QBH5_9GAMM